MGRAKMISVSPMRESVKQVAKLLCSYVSTKPFFREFLFFLHL